ncbi:hypothetical protein [Pseudanabaena sp. FACHB-2040]|uniref:hypothetical protein n=1 Tax=Pseudanabaena sp. FACHB-2040 TaxID=2692859 RepID=UPI001688E3CB|nr:hypothetical protein [Pseudanabaena sp. FACHB-2040]MBD2256504.1 hypothetical protein [Pseudanabaena sp. FACHB-2040]
MKTLSSSSTFLARYCTNPKFKQNQQVSFVGGTGRIKTYLPDSGKWTYEIEMELGPEPEIGRVGPETTILLYEADIQSVLD